MKRAGPNQQLHNLLKGSGQKQKKKLNHPESKLQTSCVTWFDLQYPKYKQLLFAIPNGGARNKVEAGIMTGEGVRAGVADMFLSVPGMITVGGMEGHGLYIEFKVGRNKQTGDQEKFEIAVELRGYDYRVVRTFEQFKEIVTNYLK